MNREQADSIIQRMLLTREFDFAQPSLRIAWTSFKDFILMPLEGLVTVTFGAEIDQIADRDDVLWASFMRRIEEPMGSAGLVVAC